MSDCRFGVSPINYPDPDPESLMAELHTVSSFNATFVCEFFRNRNESTVDMHHYPIIFVSTINPIRLICMLIQ